MKEYPLQMINDLRESINKKLASKPWFKLVPNKKRFKNSKNKKFKKHAFKKWSKKTGIWDYLRETERHVSEELRKPDTQEFIDTCLEEVAIFGHSENYKWRCDSLPLPDFVQKLHKEILDGRDQ